MTEGMLSMHNGSHYLSAATRSLTGSQVREGGRGCFGSQSMPEGAGHLTPTLRKQLRTGDEAQPAAHLP